MPKYEIRSKRKFYTAEDLCALHDDPNRWIVRDMLPVGGRVMLYGRGSTMKTMVAFDIATSIASGVKMLDGIPAERYGAVLILSTEATLQDNKERLLRFFRAKGLTPTQVHMRYCQDRFNFADPRDIRELWEVMLELRPIAVVIDPLVNFVGGDENSVRETEAFRVVVDDMIREFGSAFFILHHQGTSEEKRPRGSSAWHGWVDAELHFSKTTFRPPGVPEDYYVVEVSATKMRNGREGHLFSVVPIFDNGLQQTRFLFYTPELAGQLFMIDDQMRVCTVLSNSTAGPLTTTELSVACGLKGERLQAALASLQARGIAAQDAYALRSTSPDGGRNRRVPAWRFAASSSPVDIYKLLLQAKDAMLRADEITYQLDVQPLHTAHQRS